MPLPTKLAPMPIAVKNQQLEFERLEEGERSCLNIYWTADGWEDQAGEHGYALPEGSLNYDGSNFVEKLSFLLNEYFEAAAPAMEDSAHPEVMLGALRLLTETYISLGERLVSESLTPSLNWHQLLHIHELTNNFLRTIIIFFETVCGEPDQMGSTTRDKSPNLQLHPQLCGVLKSKHILEIGTQHQEVRVPYAPLRVGQEITYEEIANIYRTSRVNIRRIEVERCRPKLRSRLRDFKGDYTFTKDTCAI